MRLKRWAVALASIILVSSLWVSPALAGDADPVTMDETLKAALVDISAIADGDPTEGELAALSGVQNLSGKGITGLEGIAYLKNVTGLVLSGNELTSLAPLAGMTGLTSLNVDGNYLNLSDGSADDSLLDDLEADGCAVDRGTQRVLATGLALDQTAAEMLPGETLTLTATVTPSDATDKTVAWASSDTSMLTVTASGVVSAVAPGTATITASVRDGAVEATCNVVVKTTSIVSDVYNISSGVLSGVPKNTSVAELVNNLGNSASDITVYKNGQAYVGGALATGMTVSLKIKGEVRDTKTIAVSGDVNGDGMISVSDYTLVRLHLLGLSQLTGIRLSAADANNDGSMTIGDYTVIRVDIAGLKAIVGAEPDLPEVSDPRIRKFLDLALAQLGKPYVWGAEGPDSFDCSGFVWYCMSHTGGYTGSLWRATADTYSRRKDWPYVSKDKLQPGDLMFYFSDNPNDGDHIGHIGIYLGNGYHIHASSDYGRIVISRIDGWYAKMLSHGRRAFN